MTMLEEIKKYLKEEYGIMSYKDLEERMKEIDGIKIGLFVDSPVDIKNISLYGGRNEKSY